MRDVSGKEMAIYDGTTLSQWNIYGLDNIGKINADTTKCYYLKDHLGTIRAVVNSTNTVVSAGDYDAWGYPLQNRSYESSVSKYKFTGKERDKESGLNGADGYDYFGARYYNSRIARWSGVETKQDKYIGYSPYIYSLSCPSNIYDFNGKDLFVGGDKAKTLEDLKSLFSDVTIQDRITVGSNGQVSFITDGLDISSDAGIELISDLVSSKNKYLFEVADKTTGIIREATENSKIGDVYEYDLDKTNGWVNLSVTPRNIDGGIGRINDAPKDGYAGQVTLGTGNWKVPIKGSSLYQDRWNIVFHELKENFFRTEKQQPYMRENGSGAHSMAVSATKNFKRNTSIKPGEHYGYEH